MLLIVGLGNPGKEYENTRHNIGFDVIDELDNDWKNHSHDHGDEHEIHSHEHDREVNKQFSAVEYELDCEDDEYQYHVHAGLLKPLTFMNKSGEVVKPLVKYFQEQRGFEIKDHLLVVHDEMDLPLGETKLSFGRGSARHNGVQNIIDQLGTQEFSRLRVGVGRSSDKVAADHVLGKFGKDEQETLEKVKEESIHKITDWIMNAVRAGASDEH